MTYFLTIVHKKREILTEQGPFERTHDAINHLISKHYFMPPDLARNNAYVAIDTRGIAYITITRATAGVQRIPTNIHSIVIRRADCHLAHVQEEAKHHTPH